MLGLGRVRARGRTVLSVVAAVACVAAVVPPGGDQVTTDEGPAQDAATAGPALTVEQRPVVGELTADGDLEPGSEGLPVLRFDPSRRGPLDAVHEVTVRNTGTVDLADITVVDDRLGPLPLADPELVLAPGQSLVLRASESFVLEDAAGRLPAVLPRTATVTARAPDGATVTGAATSAFELVAVLEPVTLSLAVEVVAGSGDVRVGTDGVPELVWSAEDRATDASRRATVRATIRNEGAGEVGALTVSVEHPGTVDPPTVDPAVVLGPGETHTVEVEVAVAPSDQLTSVPVGAAGTVALPVGLTVAAVDATGLVTGEASGVVELRLRVAAPVLPAAGAPVSGVLTLALSVLVAGLTALRRTGRPRRA